MNKKNIAIVILNYESYWETERCVDRIIEFQMNYSGMVIVDNASKNESFQYLMQKYQKLENVAVIQSAENVGFARGNNIGIKYAKQHWNSEFILLLNSDTVMLQHDYIDRMLSKYDTNIAIVQSNALRTNGRYTDRSFISNRKSVLFCEFVDKILETYDIYSPLKYKKENDLGPYISGCDFLLTPVFFKKYEGLYPHTFLFMEENIMMLLLNKAKIKGRIAEDAILLHKESMSTPSNLKIGSKYRQKVECNGKLQIFLVRIMPLWLIKRIIAKGMR